MGESIQDQVIEILAEQAMLEPSEIEPHKSLQELGIDSLGMVEAIFAIEERFDISVPFNANDPTDSAFDISSVASIVMAIEGFVQDQKG